MLQVKSRNLNEKTPIEQCINQIEQAKSSIKSKISQYFQEFKKKLMASLEKAEKLFQAKVNEACISSIDALIKLNETELHFLEVEKYSHKTGKLVDALNGMDIELEFKNFTTQIKNNIDQIRKMKILGELPKINEEENIMTLEKTIKIEGDPLLKIAVVNKKLIQIRQNSVTIEKNTINKQFDLVLPIKLPNKQKQIIFTLNDQTIGIYNDKLILNCFKKFPYLKGQIVGSTQIQHYVIIAEPNKITRINLNNLNEIVSRTFQEEIYTLGNQLHSNLIQIGTNQKVMLLDFHTLEPLTFISVQNRIRRIITAPDSPYLVIVLSNGFKVYRNFQQVEINANIRALKVLSASTLMDKLLLVTNQLHIYYFSLQDGQNRAIETQRINPGGTKIIKSVAYNGLQIYCLSESGNKIYVHSF